MTNNLTFFQHFIARAKIAIVTSDPRAIGQGPRVGGELTVVRASPYFWNLVEKAHIIIVPLTENDSAGASYCEDESTLPSSLPFDCCWFEFGAVQPAFTTTDFGSKSSAVAAVAGLLIYEVAPEKFDIFMLASISPTEEAMKAKIGGSILIHLPFRQDEEHQSQERQAALGILQVVLKKLSNLGAATISVRHKVKIGTGAHKRHHTIRKIVYITGKKTTSIPGFPDSHVEWSHRWEVMGHWRKIASVGKNRAGDYCVQGFTWVLNHERGPEGLPLVKKVRVKIDDSLTTSKDVI